MEIVPKLPFKIFKSHIEVIFRLFQLYFVKMLLIIRNDGCGFVVEYLGSRSSLNIMKMESLQGIKLWEVELGEDDRLPEQPSLEFKETISDSIY